MDLNAFINYAGVYRMRNTRLRLQAGLLRIRNFKFRSLRDCPYEELDELIRLYLRAQVNSSSSPYYRICLRYHTLNSLIIYHFHIAVQTIKNMSNFNDYI